MKIFGLFRFEITPLGDFLRKFLVKIWFLENSI